MDEKRLSHYINGQFLLLHPFLLQFHNRIQSFVFSSYFAGIMTDLNTEMSIATATTSPIYFPILTQQCPTLVLQILSARDERAITTDVTRKQRPRLQLMFPADYTPPTALTGDQPCDGLLLQLNPQGNSGRAKCTVRVSKPATSSASIIQYRMHCQFYGTVHDLLNAARDVFGEGNQTFRYSLSDRRLHGGRDFW